MVSMHIKSLLFINFDADTKMGHLVFDPHIVFINFYFSVSFIYFSTPQMLPWQLDEIS